MNRNLTLGVVVLAGMLFAAPTAAQQISFTGEECPVPLASSIDGETNVTAVAGLDAIWIKDEHIVLILKLTESQAEELAHPGVEAETEGGTSVDEVPEAGVESVDGELYRVFYSPAEDFTELIPGLDLEDLPNAEEWPDLSNGSTGESVSSLQENLIGLGILSGSADGQFGGGTQGAVQQFQTEFGLEADGVADAVTQWAAAELNQLISGKTEEPIELQYPPVFTVEEKYADIFDQTNADLSAFLSPEWKFSYDVFDGIGYIRNNDGTDLGSVTQEERTIDQITLTARLCISALRNDISQVEVTPVIHVSTIGAYCPYIQNIQIRAGNKVTQIELSNSRRGIDETNVTEDDDVALTSEALDLLSSGEDLTIRLNGTSRSYDLNVPGGQTSAFAEAVSGLVK